MAKTDRTTQTKGLGRAQRKALRFLSFHKGLTRNQLARLCYDYLSAGRRIGRLTQNEAFNTYSVLISLQKRGLVEQREDKLWYLALESGVPAGK